MGADLVDIALAGLVLLLAAASAALAFRQPAAQPGPSDEALHRRADALSEALDRRAVELEREPASPEAQL